MEVELPRRLCDCDDGVDVLSVATGEVFMRLCFNGKPIPTDIPVSRYGDGVNPDAWG